MQVNHALGSFQNFVKDLKYLVGVVVFFFFDSSYDFQAYYLVKTRLLESQAEVEELWSFQLWQSSFQWIIGNGVVSSTNSFLWFCCFYFT